MFTESQARARVCAQPGHVHPTEARADQVFAIDFKSEAEASTLVPVPEWAQGPGCNWDAAMAEFEARKQALRDANPRWYVYSNGYVNTGKGGVVWHAEVA